MKRGIIISVIGKKGGVGKSTISTNMAVGFVLEGAEVAILDTDINQRTAAKWVDRRNQINNAPKINCYLQSESVKESALELAKKYDVVIIDVAGRDGKALRQAMIVSDIVYTPVRPSQNDLETLGDMNDLFDETTDLNPNRKVSLIFNMAPTNKMISELRDADSYVSEYSKTLPLSKAVIYERKAYRDATIDGLGVLELSDQKAIFEVKKLMSEVMSNV